ncbi:MAG: hypothetical protein U1E65_28540 [Myxococcota bacterium]
MPGLGQADVELDPDAPNASLTLSNPWGGNSAFISGGLSQWGVFANGGVVAPQQAGVLTAQQVQQAYKQNGAAAVGAPGARAVLQDEVNRSGDKQPITPDEINRTARNMDVKVLSANDYATVKLAYPGGQTTNSAGSAIGDLRGKLPTEGAERLARMRDHIPEGSPVPQASLDQAKADLKRIDPGAFETPPKDVVYVNSTMMQGTRGNPNTTKVAAHELTHLVLSHHGVPSKAQGHDPQHEVLGRLGWNQVAESGIPGETSNWGTGPGQGIPPPPTP